MSSKIFRPSSKASVYSPTQSATIAAGGNTTLTFKGLGGKRFGFNRISFGSTAPDKIRVTAKLNNELFLFQDVHGTALQNLFELKSLLSPFVIREQNTLELIITNDDGSNAVEVTIQLLGYDHVALAELDEYNRVNKRKMPEPVFISGYTTVTALQERKQLTVPEKVRDIVVRRIAMGSDDAPDIRVSLSVLNDEIKSDVFLEQLNAEYKGMNALVPIKVGRRIPVYFYLSNRDAANTRNVSFICEGYYV